MAVVVCVSAIVATQLARSSSGLSFECPDAIGYHFIERATGSMNGNFLGIGADAMVNASVQVHANPGKKGPFSFSSLYDPPTMAGITVLVMKGGHDERVERGGRGESEAVRSGRPKKWRQHAPPSVAAPA